MSTPTSRSLVECRNRGWECQVVERWCQYSRRRIDLFGCIDLIAIVPHDEILGFGSILAIQACAGASHAARRTKILAEPRMAKWLDAGGLLQIWSWAKRGARGKRKVWCLRVEAIGARSDEPMQSGGKL